MPLYTITRLEKVQIYNEVVAVDAAINPVPVTIRPRRQRASTF